MDIHRIIIIQLTLFRSIPIIVKQQRTNFDTKCKDPTSKDLHTHRNSETNKTTFWYALSIVVPLRMKKENDISALYSVVKTDANVWNNSRADLWKPSNCVQTNNNDITTNIIKQKLS